MQEIDGKIIYSEVNEIVESSHTALVVWDVQKMFIDFIFNKVEFMKNIKLLIESARRAKIPIFIHICRNATNQIRIFSKTLCI